VRYGSPRAPSWDERYAVKFLTLDNQEARSLFFAEMRVLAKLRHKPAPKPLRKFRARDSRYQQSVEETCFRFWG